MPPNTNIGFTRNGRGRSLFPHPSISSFSTDWPSSVVRGIEFGVIHNDRGLTGRKPGQGDPPAGSCDLSPSSSPCRFDFRVNVSKTISFRVRLWWFSLGRVKRHLNVLHPHFLPMICCEGLYSGNFRRMFCWGGHTAVLTFMWHFCIACSGEADLSQYYRRRPEPSRGFPAGEIVSTVDLHLGGARTRDLPH